jgi:hypothetical protein
MDINFAKAMLVNLLETMLPDGAPFILLVGDPSTFNENAGAGAGHMIASEHWHDIPDILRSLADALEQRKSVQ